MNTKSATTIGALLLSSITSFAAINIPSDGSDGVLSVSTANRTINLAAARTADWNSPSSGNGTYDSIKRAIVFKYSSVAISSGRTVTFTNHPSRAPVVWLVQGDVSIQGTLNLNGQYGPAGSLQPTEPGPGGFRGATPTGSGFGPGGGIGDASGTYSSYPYGNVSITPLIGGSGGSSRYSAYSGGGGGGGILIAAAGRITVNGMILADGGGSNAYVGSGGAIRLVADIIDGTGSMSAMPDGRIRMEANQNAGTIAANPQASRPVPTNPPTIWQADTAPSARIIAVDTVNLARDPEASSDISNPDITISANGSLTVTVQTTNFPISGSPAPRVQVRYAPKAGGVARFSPNGAYFDGDASSATWKCTVQFDPNGYSILQAIATVP